MTQHQWQNRQLSNLSSSNWVVISGRHPLLIEAVAVGLAEETAAKVLGVCLMDWFGHRACG